MRLTYTEYVSYENGNPPRSQHPGCPNPHPTTDVGGALSEVNGRRQVMTHVGIPADSPGAAGETMAFYKPRNRATIWPRNEACSGESKASRAGQVHARHRVLTSDRPTLKE